MFNSKEVYEIAHKDKTKHDIKLLYDKVKEEIENYCKKENIFFYLERLNSQIEKDRFDTPFSRLLIILGFFQVNFDNFIAKYINIDVTIDKIDAKKIIKDKFSGSFNRYKNSYNSLKFAIDSLIEILKEDKVEKENKLYPIIKKAKDQFIEDYFNNNGESLIIKNFKNFKYFFQLFFDNAAPILKYDIKDFSDIECYYTMVSTGLFIHYNIIIFYPEFIINIIQDKFIESHPKLNLDSNLFANIFLSTIFEKYINNNTTHKWLCILYLNWEILEKINESSSLKEYIQKYNYNDRYNIKEKLLKNLSTKYVLDIIKKTVPNSFLLNYKEYQKNRISEQTLQNFVTKILKSNFDCYAFCFDNMMTLLNLNHLDFENFYYYCCTL